MSDEFKRAADIEADTPITVGAEKSRRMPTTPGWWWVKYRMHKHHPADIADVYIAGDVLMVRFRGCRHVRVDSSDCDEFVEWLAPVPSAGAVQALVSAAQRVSRAIRLIGYSPAADLLDNAIAGVAGGK